MFEYKEVLLPNDESRINILNQQGAAGWELIHISSYDAEYDTALLKRTVKIEYYQPSPPVNYPSPWPVNQPWPTIEPAQPSWTPPHITC